MGAVATGGRVWCVSTVAAGDAEWSERASTVSEAERTTVPGASITEEAGRRSPLSVLGLADVANELVRFPYVAALLFWRRDCHR